MRALIAVDMDKNIPLSTRRRWLAIGLAVYALFFLASETVAKELTASSQFAVAVAIIVAAFFVVLLVHEVRKAFRLGADGGEAVVHGLMQAFRVFVGMRPKDPPKY